MKLDFNRPDFAVQARRRSLEGLGHSRVSGWVKLLELPNPWSFDEAVSQDEWLAWIPDCGEAILNIRQFSH
ncbi:MAG: hypothetical protein PUP90_23390 [Nostoc sp. S4]|nr:hypothetical protein [Nostoc sp. S4]